MRNIKNLLFLCKNNKFSFPKKSSQKETHRTSYSASPFGKTYARGAVFHVSVYYLSFYFYSTEPNIQPIF